MDGRSLVQALHDLAHAIRETGRTLAENRTLAAAVSDHGSDRQGFQLVDEFKEAA